MNKQLKKMNENTRQNIIDAFWLLYVEKDISKISVMEIVQKAGYNRSTFYYYFKNPQDILDCIENEIVDSLINIAINNKDLAEMPEKVTVDITNFYEEYSKYIMFLFSEKGDSQFVTKLENAIRHIFHTNHKDKVKDIKEFDILYSFITSAFIGFFKYWSNSNGSTTLEDFLKFLFKLSNLLLNSDILNEE